MWCKKMISADRYRMYSDFVYKRAREEMNLEEEGGQVLGEMKEIGNFNIPVIGRFKETIKIWGWKLNG